MDKSLTCLQKDKAFRKKHKSGGCLQPSKSTRPKQPLRSKTRLFETKKALKQPKGSFCDGHNRIFLSKNKAFRENIKSATCLQKAKVFRKRHKSLTCLQKAEVFREMDKSLTCLQKAEVFREMDKSLTCLQFTEPLTSGTIDFRSH